MANGYTDDALAGSRSAAAQTEVMFTEDTDLDQDGKYEYVEGESYDFTVDTGLDMIGHAATVYYTIEKKAPVVFALVDDAALVSVIDYNRNTTRLAGAANDAGFRRNTILNISTEDYIFNYDFGTTMADAETQSLSWANTDAIDANDLPNGRS